MEDPIQFEEDYRRFISDLSTHAPDGVIEVNLELLNELGLLDEEHWTDDEDEEKFPHAFHVIEANDKVTLYNEQFVIWISPKMINGEPLTLTLISLITDDAPCLEIVFSSKGIYNTPKCILKILKLFLEEVIDTQDVISSIGNT